MEFHRKFVAPSIVLPESDEIHVWSRRLDDTQSELSDLSETLTIDERDRAARFYFEKHRRRFIVARTTLRAIIGRYLQVEAGEIRFDYAAKGKPLLAQPKVENFAFNISHSADLAIFAFTIGVPIGVDVEIIRPFDSVNEVAKRFFSAHEYEMLQQIPEGERIEAFFNCWTRKEAYIKAEGQGLSIPLDTFTVSLAPEEAARFIHMNSGGAHAWSLHHLRPAIDAVGAVAIPALNRRIVARQFLAGVDSGGA